MAQQWTAGEVSLWLGENELADYQQVFVGEHFYGCAISVSTVLHKKTNI